MPEELAAIDMRAKYIDALETVHLPAADYLAMRAGLKEAWRERDVVLRKMSDAARLMARVRIDGREPAA